jgi:hypothetical protein
MIDKIRRPLNHSELAILHHPDRLATWIVVATAFLTTDDSQDPAQRVIDKINARLETLSQALPSVSSRLDGLFWIPAERPRAVIGTDDNKTPDYMLEPFNLTNEPPLRILVSPNGDWVSFFVHHAALDGARLILAIKILLCNVDPPPPNPDRSIKSQIPWATLRRLLAPADPIAPSFDKPTLDTFVSRQLPIVGLGITAKLPQLCLRAACEFSAIQGKPCKRIGLSLGIAPDDGPENRSTYRRIDARIGVDMTNAIETALSTPIEPWEIKHSSRLLKYLGPLANRASDTILLTNLGRQSMPGITKLEGYPVARGRSGVSFAAVRIIGGESTLSLRTRDINYQDATLILDKVISLLEGPE